MESLAESETPLEIIELSNGSILFNIFAMTENSRPKSDFLVNTNSSGTPPPSTPEIKQLITAGNCRFLAEIDGSKRRMSGDGKLGLSDKSVAPEIVKSLAVAVAMIAMYRYRERNR